MFHHLGLFFGIIDFPFYSFDYVRVSAFTLSVHYACLRVISQVNQQMEVSSCIINGHFEILSVKNWRFFVRIDRFHFKFWSFTGFHGSALYLSSKLSGQRVKNATQTYRSLYDRKDLPTSNLLLQPREMKTTGEHSSTLDKQDPAANLKINGPENIWIKQDNVRQNQLSFNQVATIQLPTRHLSHM